MNRSALLSLFAVIRADGADWADGVDGVDVVPRPGRPNRIDFVLMTDLDGRFRFDVPLPTVERQFLEAKPSPFVDSFMRYFGDETLGNQPALAEGQRDLGNLRLARAGVIRGRVVDELGRPIEDVDLGTDENRSANDSRGGVSDADGRFEIAHARIGTYRVRAWKKGWINNFRDGVTVEVEQVSADVVLVLMPAKTIEGRVVDTLGQPVGNVKFWGWPSSSGSGAGGRSGDDGRFVISLPQDEPYSLEAKCDGYNTWGKGHGVFYEPGTRDLEIVMETIAPTQFRAMDDVTGEPLMSFGLDILEENGSKSLRSMFSKRRRPRIESPAEGVLARTARPGIDLFVAAADGYLLAEGDVEHRPNGEPEQTIRLRRAAVVMGRALHDGQPVVNAVVQLDVVSIQFVESQARSPSSQQNFGEQEEVILWSGVEGSDSVTAYTGAHGRTRPVCALADQLRDPTLDRRSRTRRVARVRAPGCGNWRDP